MRKSRKFAEVTLLVTIMLLAPIAGAAGAAGSTAPNVTSTDDSEFVTPQEGVSIWKQSPIALQADTDDADVTAELPSIFAESPGEYYPDGKLNRSSVGIYEEDEQVTLRFGNDIDATRFDGDAQLVTLHDDSPINEELASDSAGEDFGTVIEELNPSTTPVTVEDGTFTAPETLNQGPGYYTFIVTDTDLSDLSDGDMPEDVTIFGVAQAIVHEEPSSVDVASSAEAGDNVTFDVDATAFGDGDVEHSVVLYNESTLTDSDVTITVPEAFTSGLTDADDVSIETDLGSINGVHTMSNGAESQSLNETLVFDEIIESTIGGQDLNLVHTGDRRLDASSTAVVGNASENITVETLGNWSESDDYRWIHLATSSESSSGLLQANTGTLEIEAASGGSGGSGGGGGIGGGGGTPTDPEFSVTKAGLSSSEIAVGEDVDVTAKIEEVSGDRGGQFTAELTVDGEVVDTETVTVFANESANVTFTESFDEVGEYEIAVSDASAGTLVVTETGPGGPGNGDGASFEVTDISLSDADLEVGDEFDVTATVENTGSEAGTYTAELTVDGSIVAEQTVTLNSGETETVTFTHSFDEAGEYEIEVSGISAGTVSVSEDSGLAIPGFGMASALVAVLAVALLAARVHDT